MLKYAFSELRIFMVKKNWTFIYAWYFYPKGHLRRMKLKNIAGLRKEFYFTSKKEILFSVINKYWMLKLKSILWLSSESVCGEF